MILLSARKNSPQQNLLSRQLTKEEADLENLAIVRIRQLIIDKSVDRKDLKVHLEKWKADERETRESEAPN